MIHVYFVSAAFTFDLSYLCHLDVHAHGHHYVSVIFTCATDRITHTFIVAISNNNDYPLDMTRIGYLVPPMPVHDHIIKA